MCQTNKKILGQQAFNEFRGREVAPGSEVQTDEELDEFIREKSDTDYHPSCTCKMGSDKDPMAVVNQDAKIHGLENILLNIV